MTRKKVFIFTTPTFKISNSIILYILFFKIHSYGTSMMCRWLDVCFAGPEEQTLADHVCFSMLCGQSVCPAGDTTENALWSLPRSSPLAYYSCIFNYFFIFSCLWGKFCCGSLWCVASSVCFQSSILFLIPAIPLLSPNDSKQVSADTCLSKLCLL